MTHNDPPATVLPELGDDYADTVTFLQPERAVGKRWWAPLTR